MSADQENPTDTYAMLGASVALSLAGLPFNGPIGAVRVGCVDGKLLANPTYAQLDESDIDLVVAGNRKVDHDGGSRSEIRLRKRCSCCNRLRDQHIKRQVEAINKVCPPTGHSEKGI